MSGNRIVALIIVAIIHLAVGYALITGLAYSSIRKAIERVTTVDVETPPPPTETPPPPPPDKMPPPPPIVAPPPPINIAVAPPAITTVREAPPPPPVIIPVARPPAPPPPPPPQQANPTPKGRPQNWVTNNDYPSRALREEEQGTTRFSVSVNTEGRVASCTVTGSSGHDDLDQAVCRLITSRARFNPAKDSNGQPMTGTWASSFRWEIPKD
jgi:protein TonB